MKTYNIPVFIINMYNRTDRKNHMIGLMKELGFINYNFVIPYKADQNTKMLFENILGRNSNLPLTKISHNMTYLDILRTNVDEMIILEDDIIPTKSIKNIQKDLDTILSKHPHDATMIYLEMCYEKCSFVNSSLPSTTFIKLENPNCAASIYYPNKILRFQLYHNLINRHNTLYINPIDEEFRNIINKYGISVYMLSILFIQDERFGSDLEGSVGYNLNKKPLLPVCETYNKTLEYILKDDEISKNIKHNFIKHNSVGYFSDINESFSYLTNEKKVEYYRLFTIFIILVLFYLFMVRPYCHSKSLFKNLLNS